LWHFGTIAIIRLKLKSMRRFQYPLVKLPKKIDKTVFLIQQELRITLMINKVAEAGFGPPDSPVSLEPLILQEIGFEEFPDDLIGLYVKLVEEACSKASIDDVASCSKQALKMYHVLVEERRRRDN
jgi:hypothetical protein